METTSRLQLRENVSHDLKLRFRGTASAVGATTLTVVEFGDVFSDATSPRAAYVQKAAADNVDFRRIAEFDAATGVVTTNRAHAIANTDPVDLYLILTPVDWNEAITRALRRLYFTDRITIPFVSGTSLYAMPEGWLQVRNQVERVIFRFTSTLWTEEQDAASYDVIQDANAVSILFGALPGIDSGSFEIIVEGRHFYEALANDAATTTCPRQLIEAQLRVSALWKVWSLMGETEAKKEFGQEMLEAQRNLLDVKKQLIPQMQPSPIRVTRPQLGPELPVQSYRW